MRRRILLLVVGMTTLVVLAFAIPLTIFIRNNAYDDAVTDLRRQTDNVALTMFRLQQNGTLTTATLRRYLATLGRDRSASVEYPDGTVVGSLPPGGRAPLPAVPTFGRGGGGTGGTGADPAAPAPGGAAGGRDVTPGSYRGGRLSVAQVPRFGADGGGRYVVRVWAGDGALHAGQTTPLLVLAGASVLLLLVGVGAGELLTRRIVRPLTETADTAQRIAAGDVAARAPTAGPPEVADVGRALNRLADRIDELIAEERETVADLSHRLRTPLTALRLDAEGLDDAVEADRMGQHVTTLERMLTAVIHAARRPQREGRMPSCDATAVVAGRVEFWSALTEEQGRAAAIDLPTGPLPVRAGAEDLAAAVDALLENVVAHTPEGTAFGVRLAAEGSGARLTVSDDGPGLPDESPVRGRSDRGSTGLGLDIARRCAEGSGGGMTLGAGPSGGALVTLLLGGP